MSAIARFDPFRPLATLDPFRGFDEVFGARPLRDLPAAPEIRIEVAESDKAYTVKAEIPGVAKDDIEVSVEGRQVSIGAQVRRETEKKEGKTVIHSERYYGKAYRSFALPGDVDEKKTEAVYENGVLTLTMPRRTNGNTRRIAIK